jgi:hypothetical protein
LAMISLRAERELGISGAELQQGAALAMQYYKGAASARAYLETYSGKFTAIIQPSVAAFLPGTVDPNAIVGVRVYFERSVKGGAVVGASVVVNVRAGSGIRDVADAAMQAVLNGDIQTGHASPGGGVGQNATIIGISGYSRNGAATLVLPE